MAPCACTACDWGRQVLSSYNDVYEIPWPRAIIDMYQWINLIQLDMFSMPALSCVYPNRSVACTQVWTWRGCRTLWPMLTLDS